MNRLLLEPLTACEACLGSGRVLIRPGLNRPCECRYHVIEAA